MSPLKLLVKGLLLVVVAVLIGLTALLIILQTHEGQRRASSYLVERLERETRTHIHVGKVKYTFPFHFRFETLSIEQADRPLLSIGSVECLCSLTGLLQGSITISKLQVIDVHLQNPWERAPDAPQSLHPWDAPFLPFYFKIKHLDIQHIRLNEKVVDAWEIPSPIRPILQDALFNIEGVMKHRPFQESIAAHLLITMHPTDSEIVLGTLNVEAQDHELSLSLNCRGLPVYRVISSLPAGSTGDISLQASAPTLAWQRFIQGSSLSDTPIEGHMQLSLLAPLDPSTGMVHLIEPRASLRGRYVLYSKKWVDFLDLEGNSSGVAANGKATWSSNGTSQRGYFQGEAHLSSPLTIGDQPLSIAIENALEWDQEHLHCQTTATTLHTHIESSMTRSASHAIWEGEVAAHIDDIRDMQQFWPIHFSGKGVLLLQLSASSATPERSPQQIIRGQFNGQEIKGDDWSTEELQLSLETDSLPIDEDLLRFSSNLEVTHLRWKEYAVDKLSLHADQKGYLTQRQVTALSLEAKAEHIRSPEATAVQATGRATLNSPFEAMEGTIEIAIADIDTATLHLENVEARSSIRPEQHESSFRIAGEGKWREQFLFLAEGTWSLASGVLEIHADHLTGELGPYSLRLLQQLHIRQSPSLIQLTGLHLEVGEAEIQATGSLERDLLSLSFKTSPMPSALFRFLAPETPFNGRASLMGHLEGSLNDPVGEMKINLQDMQITEDIFATKPLINGRLELRLEKGDVQMKSELNGIGRTPLLLSGTLPVIFCLSPFSVGIDADRPFSLNLNAEGDLNPYLHLFYNDVVDISGQTKIALKFSGSLHDPHIQGYAHFLNGSYESESTGTVLHGIQAHLQGEGSKITLSHFSAQDSKQGMITATGYAILDPSRHFPFDIRLHSSRLFILNSDYASVSATGPLTLIGNIEHAKLEGELTIDHAALHLEQTLPRQIKTVDVKYVNWPEGSGEYTEKKEKPSRIDLNVSLQAAHTVTIEGHHLKSEWKGSITVTGTPQHPQLHGDLRISEGTYDFNGKIFHLTQGNIHFAGPPDKKTTLYVTASKEIDRIRAEIIVKGPVHKPAIHFRSSPPLSQREVLSYILFNRGISDITADQGDQLSQSFISLNSNEQTKASSDFLSRLRNNIGIDRLDFTSPDQENQEFGLQVGKNITENISLSVNQSMTSATPVIAVEARLRKNFKVQAEAGVDANTPVRMSLKWKKDY